MTLYNNFASKDALIWVVYTEYMEAAVSEEDRALAVFDRFAQAGAQSGCQFIDAGLEAAEARGPVYRLVQQYKQALRGYLPILLGGGVIEGYLQGVRQPARSARRAAATLLRCKG